MDEGRDVLLDIGVDAQPGVVGHGDDRLGRAVWLVVAFCTSAPGSAKRAVTWPSNGATQPLIGFQWCAYWSHVGLGDARRRHRLWSAC